jgi:DNA-binding NtrC family response regulator
MSGPHGGPRAEVKGQPLTIGRSRTTNLSIDDSTISAIHVELSIAPDGVRVRDLTSSNGTVYAGAFVNDIVVASGSTIRVGRTEIVLEIVDDGRAATAFDVEEVGRLCGTSGPMRGLYALLSRLAPTPLSVVVEGEDGTEKDLVARAVHEASPRADKPLVFVDCGGSSQHAASLLFGEAGAIAEARGGTLVLLEIDALALDVQVALEEVLRRAGPQAAGAMPYDVRLVSTVRGDLAAHVNAERFREDLYDFVAKVRVRVPPLRERGEDIAALAYRALQDLPPDVEAARTLARDALGELKRRDWPGNVRELRAVVERAALLASGASITANDLAFERRLTREREAPQLADAPVTNEDGTLTPFKDAKKSLVEEFERGYLVRLMERAGGSVTKAATIAGLERHHVRDLLRKHGLHPSSPGPGSGSGSGRM